MTGKKHVNQDPKLQKVVNICTWGVLPHPFLPAATKLWPRLCFYTCLWFCTQGGGLQRTPPEPGRHHPPGPRRTPPSRENPPGPRRTPPDQADPPQQGDPPGKKTATYGQWAAGTHPTGMHSCITNNPVDQSSVESVIITSRRPTTLWGVWGQKESLLNSYWKSWDISLVCLLSIIDNWVVLMDHSYFATRWHIILEKVHRPCFS